MGRVKIVRASAGSGKTYRLSCEYVKRALADPEGYRHILAVTFTNKATEEMKRRILREVNHLANGATPEGGPPAFAAEIQQDLKISGEELRSRAARLRTRILHDYSRFTILTIDKFFQRIIRAFIRELGVENDFTLELQTESVLGSAADRLIEETLSDEKLRDWIGRYLEEQLDEGRKWDIKQEITALGKEIFSEEYSRAEVSAETRERLQAIVSEASGRVKQIETRMTGIAGEALRILDENGLAREDFPYGKSGFINYFFTVAAGDCWGGYGKRVADALESDEKWYAKTSARKEAIQALVPRLKPMLAELCATYDQSRSFAHTTALLRENFRAYALLNDLAGYVREACDERNVMLISETNRIIGELIAGNDTPFIFEKAGNHFTHFMIDEFQDTSGAQWNNFLPLLSNAVAQSPEDPVLLVGDVKQSIYRWRGGDWRILGEAVNRAFAETEELTLGTNYRSAGNIVRFNNEMISAAVQSANEELNGLVAAANETGIVDDALREGLRDILARAYTGSRQAAKAENAGRGYVKWIQYDREEEGAQHKFLVETIENLQRRGFRPREIAVLVRYNAEAVAAADFLLDYKSAHPDSPFSYDVVTQEALTIGKAPVVRFVIACFRLAVNPEDSISRALFLKTLGRLVTEEPAESDQAFIAGLRNLPLEEALEQVLLEYRPDRQPGSVAYLQAFHDQVLAFAGSRIADIPLFLKWWDETGAAESVHLPGGQDAVTIITIHKAKGLEFPAVILPYASWDMNPNSRTLLWSETGGEPFDGLGKMPVRYKKTMAESGFAADYYKELVYTRVDNLNMLYVALTRAEEELYLMTPRVKEPKGSRVYDLLLRSVRADEQTVAVGDYPGERSETEGHLIYEWGSPVRKTASGERNNSALPQNDYPTFRFSGKLRLKRDAERYRDGDGEWQLSPRQYGRLMHRVFESVSAEAEIGPALDRFEVEGVLSAEDRKRVEDRIAEAFSDPQIRRWFSDEWEVVRNENDIIVPAHTASVRRPDRVMIGDGRVVVVDYKFGEQENRSYVRQLEEYLGLIHGMGYASVEGYIWYVETRN